MQRARNLYGSSVGKKVAMAASGVFLFGFVIAHLLGNLKIYQGAAKFDAYAHGLRELGKPLLGHGQALWIMRFALLAAVGIHIVAAVQVTLASRAARRTSYVKRNDLSFTYASRTMRWGGAILLAFVVYHLLHLTLGTAHHDFGDSAYHNVVAGFRLWPVSLAYAVAMLPLGLHIYHGLWSATQTLSIRNPKLLRIRRGLAAALAIFIVVGNLSIPLSVLAGWVEPGP